MATKKQVPAKAKAPVAKEATNVANKTTPPKRPTVKELQAEIGLLTEMADTQTAFIRDLQQQLKAYALTVDNYEQEVTNLRRENKELFQELYKEVPPPKGWFAKLLEKMGA